MNIKFQGAVYNCSGYARIRHIFLELSKKYNVRLEPFKSCDSTTIDNSHYYKKLETTCLNEPYINIVSGIGPQIRRDPKAAYNIAYSMFETFTIPEKWIPFYNEFDEIWTPSEFCKKSFEVKNLDCIVSVIPLGYDDLMFFPKKKEHSSFTFLSVGQWIDRKGWDLLINAYTTEFLGDNNVRLCIKTNNECKTSQELIKEYLTTDQTSHMPRISINNAKIDESLMSEIYQEADCYVCPSRGEAFGLPFVEAMACGIPCIATDFGGQKDFINNSNGWLIPITKLQYLSERLCKINAGYQGLWFAEPEIKEIRKAMRYVYEHRSELEEKGKNSLQTAKKYTWQKVTEIAEKRLINIQEALK